MNVTQCVSKWTITRKHFRVHGIRAIPKYVHLQKKYHLVQRVGSHKRAFSFSFSFSWNQPTPDGTRGLIIHVRRAKANWTAEWFKGRMRE